MISVCMATYNGEKFIKKQVESILCQLNPEDELIVSDDGSKDKTVTIINSISDLRIQLYINEGCHGVIPNFENALKKAKGNYIFLSDQDDIWMPYKIATCIPLLQQNLLVVHNAVIIDGNGFSTDRDYFNLRGSKEGYWNNIWRNSYLGCCMCFRSELLRYILPFPRNIEMHDRWVGLISQLYGKVYFESKCLIGYRVHGGNVSNSTGKSTNSFFQMLMIRFWLLCYTIGRYFNVL